MIDPFLALGCAIGTMPNSAFTTQQTAKRAGQEARTLKEETMQATTYPTQPAVRFIGTKLIRAEPMTRGFYNAFRGWTMPPDEQAEESGYLVEYLDGGKPNLPTHEGYVTWTPKEAFDAAYRPCDSLNFGLAIEALKKGLKVARTGWNGKGMFVYLVPPGAYPASTQIARKFFGADALVPYNAYLALKGVDGTVSTWAPSCSDALADDWQIVE